MGKTTIRRGITLKAPDEIAAMRQAGRIVALALTQTAKAAQPGVSTADLDRLAEQVIRDHKAVPSFKGYRGYPATLCTSLNEEIVHGIPNAQRVLREGDLIKIDCGAIYDGWQGDAAVTVPVGRVGKQAAKLVEDTRAALSTGVGRVCAGGHVGDIGAAIEEYALSRGYEVVREYCGHGIGRALHEEPPIHNFGAAGEGPELRPGMVICIEPMLNLGTWETAVQEDGWTVKTADGKLSAHFEHTVAVTDQGPAILTLP